MKTIVLRKQGIIYRLTERNASVALMDVLLEKVEGGNNYESKTTTSIKLSKNKQDAVLNADKLTRMLAQTD